MKSGTPCTTADMKVPAIKTVMPPMITAEQRPPSMTGPTAMRLAAAAAEKAGRVINVTDDLPKTFVITTPPGKKAGEDMVYLCQLSTGTLKKRSGR